MECSIMLLEVETKECMKERNKRLLEKVGDYLKSDTYMYSPLCAQPAIYSKSTVPSFFVCVL